MNGEPAGEAHQILSIVQDCGNDACNLALAMSGYEREADIPWRDLGRLLVAEAVEELPKMPFRAEIAGNCEIREFLTP